MQRIRNSFVLHTTYSLFWVSIIAIFLSGFKSAIDVSPAFRAITETPKRITLLLPLHGQHQPMGESILAGFMTANKAEPQPMLIHIVDTTQSHHTVQNAYLEAIQNNADLVIGPLLKKDVEKLSQQPTLTLPVLTLNYLEKTQIAPANFYQFGLSPLDEIQALIQQAKINGHRSAIIIAPKNHWGENLAQTFQHFWESNDGEVVGHLYYKNNPSTLHQQTRQFLNKLYTENHTTHPDFVFLAASSEVARQINPAIAFHAAADLSVYATTSVYDESIPTHLNRDLNRIILCDAPWSLQTKHAYPKIRARCIKQRTEHFSQHKRYYALGVDAFHVAKNLPQLDQNNQKSIMGASGILTLDNDRRIRREPSCAQFKRETPYTF